LFLKDSLLILYNSKGKNNYFFYNYFLNKDSLSKGYLSSGRGVGESLGAMSSGLNNNILWTHDLVLKKILVADITKSSNTSNIVFKEYPLEDKFYMMESIGNLNFLGVGKIDSPFKIQKIYLQSGKVNKEFGEFKHVPTDKPFESYKTAYDCFIFKKPSGDKVVLIYRFSDIIEIFDLKKNTSFAIQGPDSFNVDFIPISIGSISVMGRTEKTKFSFVNGYTTDDYIYTLYSGKLANSLNSDYSNYILVYDWNGNPIKKIVLDKNALSFCISNDNKEIYIYNPDTGYIMKEK
jgi:hypothetical protein